MIQYLPSVPFGKYEPWEVNSLPLLFVILVTSESTGLPDESITIIRYVRNSVVQVQLFTLVVQEGNKRAMKYTILTILFFINSSSLVKLIMKI